MGFALLKTAAELCCFGIVLIIFGLCGNIASNDSRRSRIFRFPVKLGVTSLFLAGILALLGGIMILVSSYIL